MPQQAQASRYHDSGTAVAVGPVTCENTVSPSVTKSKAGAPPYGESCNLVVEGWLGLFDNCSLDRLANVSYPSRIRGSQLTGEALSTGICWIKWRSLTQPLLTAKILDQSRPWCTNACGDSQARDPNQRQSTRDVKGGANVPPPLTHRSLVRPTRRRSKACDPSSPQGSHTLTTAITRLHVGFRVHSK